MKNQILAIASILTTALLTLPPAFAEDFNINGSGSTALAGESSSDAMGISQGASLNPKDMPAPCSACAAHSKYGRLQDHTLPGAAGAIAPGGTKENNGTR
jgi:hypothetical protein